MNLYITDTPIRARQIWRLLGCDGDVALPVPDGVTISGLGQDHQPVWSYEKSLRALVEHARKADQVWMCQRATDSGDWMAAMLRDFLGTYTQAPVFRSRQHAVTTPPDVGEWDHDAVKRWTAKLVGDHLVGVLAKPFKKAFGTALSNFGVDELRALQKVARAYSEPSSSGMVAQRRRSTVADITAMSSVDVSPEHALNDLMALHDAGMLSVGPDAATELRVVNYVHEQLGSVAGLEPATDRVLPTDPAMTVGVIAPQQRKVWLNACSVAFAECRDVAFTQSWPAGCPWLGDILTDSRAILALGRLREDGLVRGWSYVRPTDLGWFLHAGIADVDTTLPFDQLSQQLADVRFYRACCSLCDCRGALDVVVNRGRISLLCGSCGQRYPAEFHDRACWRASPRSSWSWCRACRQVVDHSVVLNPVTRALKFTCKGCATTFED